MSNTTPTSPAIEAANAALDALGYTRQTPRAEIKPEHWHLIEELDAATEAALDAADADPNFLGTLDFIIASEDGSITPEQFEASVQAFVNTGVWRSLQGSWCAAVHRWQAEGLVA